MSRSTAKTIDGVRFPLAVSTNRPAVQIRPAAREDIPALVWCNTTSVTEEEEVGFGPPISQRSFADPEKLLIAWREPNRVGASEIIVAELDGRVVGYVTVKDRGDALELFNIDVQRDHQGRGIGSHLVRFVEERARQEGKRAVTLGTSRSAAGVPWKSFGWWQSHGYRVTGEEENDWTRSIGNGIREIRMRKDIL